MPRTRNPIPAGFHTATPYLTLKDTASAIEFYKKAFGAIVLTQPSNTSGIGTNAEIRIGDSPIMISGRTEVATSEHQALHDLPPVSIYLYVEDVDTFVQQAIAAGAKELYAVQDMDYGNREGGLVDPFGIIWWIASRISQKESPKGYVLKAGEGVLAGRPDLKATRVSTGGSLTIIESHTDGGAPRHVHSLDDEFFYVLDGTLIVHSGDEQFEAGPRAFVFLPHDWDVLGESATLLMMTAPAGLEEFLDEYHTVSGASNEIKDQVAAKYGITWIRKAQPEAKS